jgi:hypothetical protein
MLLGFGSGTAAAAYYAGFNGSAEEHVQCVILAMLGVGSRLGRGSGT